MTKRVLITGGAGFIGSHAAHRFLRDGWAVRVFDNLATGDMSNLTAIEREIDFCPADLRDQDALAASMDGVDVVLHLGALGSVPRSLADPKTSHEVNATGTLNVLVAARDAQASRVVFSSSSSVFGSNRELPKSEDMAGSPMSPYAATKRIGEDYCRQFHEFFGLDTVVVRFFNVFGPGQSANHAYAAVIPKFIDAAVEGRPVEVHGDGLQSRDFTYVENAIDGLALLADTGNSGLAGEVYHLACGESISLLEILDSLEPLIGLPIARNHVDSRAGDIRDSLASIEKIRRATGYTPMVTATDGLAKTVAWFQQNRQG